MAELENRLDREAELARQIARLHNEFRFEILDYWGDDPEDLEEELWTEITNRYRGLLYAAIVTLFIAAAQQYLDELDTTVVEETSIEERAEFFARNYIEEAVPRIVRHSRERLLAAVRDFFELPLTMGELRERLARVFGPVRAETVAATEVTRAAVAGEMEVAQLLRERGFVLRAIWRTSEDETVCPTCAPLEGGVQGIDWHDPPPAHSRCRCFVVHEVIPQ